MSGLENAHVFPSDKVLSCLSIDANHGLDVSEVERRRLKYGRNGIFHDLFFSDMLFKHMWFPEQNL